MKRIVSLMTSLTCFVLLGAQYTIVDLFSGIGGLSYGFSQYPEFKVLAANEYDLEIAKAYELNHPGVTMLTCGVEDVTSNMMQKATGGVKVDLVIGGRLVSRIQLQVNARWMGVRIFSASTRECLRY